MQQNAALYRTIHATLLIPDLKIDSASEALIDTQFSPWADHFRQDLAVRGVAGLLDDYERLVRSVELQSCDHGHGQNSGAAWQNCCGVSYAYRNDLAVRDAIAIIIRAAPATATERWQARIQSLDTRLRALYRLETVPVGPWWHAGLPRGVLD